jgi:hypothetical protein
MSDYNGYTNYETFNLVTWLENDYFLYFHMCSWYDRYVADTMEQPRDANIIAAVKVALRRAWRTQAERPGTYPEGFDYDNTPDGISLTNKAINWGEVAACVREFCE